MTSRFDSAVSVQLEGADRRYIPDAMHLMDVVMQRRTAGDLTMVKGYRRINDSTYAYAISAGGVNIVRVVSDEDERCRASKRWSRSTRISSAASSATACSRS
jgi:hypothetical protein